MGTDRRNSRPGRTFSKENQTQVDDIPTQSRNIRRIERALKTQGCAR
jgi:hypothetical protein